MRSKCSARPIKTRMVGIFRIRPINYESFMIKNREIMFILKLKRLYANLLIFLIYFILFLRFGCFVKINWLDKNNIKIN